MPAAAGTGLDRRPFLLRGGGADAVGLRRTRLGLGLCEAGIAQAAGRDDPVLVSVFLDGGIDSLSVLAPVGDTSYRTCARSWRSARRRARRSREDARLAWHPSPRPLATLHGEGKLTVMPAIGYDHPDQSHFTSRHFWEVGALDPTP